MNVNMGIGEKCMDKIETERLVLRQFTEEDAENVWMNFGSSASVYQYLPWDCHKDIKESRRMVQLWEKRDNVADGLYYCIDLKKKRGGQLAKFILWHMMREVTVWKWDFVWERSIGGREL